MDGYLASRWQAALVKVGSCLGQRAVICRDSAVAYLRGYGQSLPANCCFLQVPASRVIRICKNLRDPLNMILSLKEKGLIMTHCRTDFKCRRANSACVF